MENRSIGLLRNIITRGSLAIPRNYPSQNVRIVDINYHQERQSVIVEWGEPYNYSHQYIKDDSKKLTHDGVLWTLDWYHDEEPIWKAYGWPENRFKAAKKSPDIITDNKIIEVGTSLKKGMAEDYYRDKVAKYQSAVASLTGEPGGFTVYNAPSIYVIIVHDTGVFSNLHLNQDEVDMMVSVVISGRRCVTNLRLEGVLPPDEASESLKAFSREISSFLETKGIDKHGDLFINKALDDIVETTEGINFLTLFEERWKETELDLHLPDLRRLREAHKDNIRELVKSHMTNGSIKPNQAKPISVMPFMHCSKDDEDKLPDHGKIGSGTIELNLWRKALMYAEANPERFMKKSETFEPMSSLAPEDKAARKRYQVVELDLSTAEAHKLYLSGVQAHSYMRAAGITEEQSKNQRKKAPFDLDTPVKDIFDFVMKFDCLKEIDDPELFEDINKVRLEHEQNTVSETAMNYLRRSTLHRRLHFISAIVEELNFSTVKFTTDGRFLVKKVPGFHAWLLIKTVSPETHIHFSILCKRDDAVGSLAPFRNFDITNSEYVCTEFMSLNRMKISHLIGCHERMAAIAIFWFECYGFSLERLITELKDKTKQDSLLEVRRMINFCTCIYLEMSNKTSQDLQQVRYAYMEVCCIKLMPANPLKILTKLNTKVRSRLTVFVQKQIMRFFSRMTEVRCENEQAGQDSSGPSKFDLKFTGLLNFVTGSPISKFNIALNLSYLGYIHIKGDFVINQGLWKVYSKIISEEIATRHFSIAECRKDPYKGKKNHNFSMPFVKSMGDALDRFLTSKLGPKYRDTIFDDWKKMLVAMTLDTVASLKASAIRPKNEKVEPIQGNVSEDAAFAKVSENEGSRTKVLARVAELLRNNGGVHVWASMKPILDKLIELDCVYADLFQKQQIGGVREIFILDIESRLMILMTETLCRCIGRYLPSEMMTKPDAKSVVSRNHHKETQERKEQLKNGKSVTTIDSGDCTTWAQQFVMPVFWIVISAVCPPALLGVLRTTLNLHASKKLQLPSFMLTKFMTMPHIQSYDPAINELKDQFLGRSAHNDLLNPLSRVLFNKSNMAQGILHYMSSVYHCAFKLVMNEVNEAFTRSIFKGKVMFHRSDKVSSDDFACLRSIVWSGKKLKTTSVAIYLTRLSKLEELCMQLACIKQSTEKSTIAALNFLEEFNSQFMVSNSLMTPLIKFMYVATELKAEESMSGRFHLLSNLRRQIPENGGSLLLASVVQSAQEKLHYIALGRNSNPKTFSKYLELQEGMQCVSLGLMPLEPEGLCGLIGHNLAYYLKIQNSINCNMSESYFYKRAGYTVSENGTPYIRVSVLLGQARTAREFIKNAGLPMNWREVIEANPRCLFFGPSNTEEALAKLMMKMSQPGSYSSFSYMSPNKAYSPACYILDHPCVTFVELDRVLSKEPVVQVVELEQWPAINEVIQPTEEERMDMEIAMDASSAMKLKKTSLIRALREITHESLLSKMEIDLLFPHSAFYNDMKHRADLLNRGGSSYKTNLPSRKNIEIEVPRTEATSLLSALKACKLMWYTDTDIESHYKLRESWSDLKDKLPWIEDTLEGTLQSRKCPFDSAIQVYNYIAGISLKVPTIRVQGNLSMRDDTMSTIYSILRNCYDPVMRRGDVLISTGEDPDKPRLIEREELYNSAVSRLSIASHSTRTKEKMSMALDILDEYAGNMLSDDLHYGKTDQMRLLVIARHMKRIRSQKGSDGRGTDATSDQLKKDLMRSGVGQIVYWKKRAQFEDGKWYGRAILRVETSDGRYELHLSDNSVVKVVVGGFKDVRTISMDILSKIKRFNYTDSVTAKMVRDSRGRYLRNRPRGKTMSWAEFQNEANNMLINFSTGSMIKMSDLRTEDVHNWVLVEEGLPDENYRFRELTFYLKDEELILRTGDMSDIHAYNIVRLRLRPNPSEFAYFTEEEGKKLMVPYASNRAILPRDVTSADYIKMFKERLRYFVDIGSGLRLQDADTTDIILQKEEKIMTQAEVLAAVDRDEEDEDDFDIDSFAESMMSGDVDITEELALISGDDTLELTIDSFNIYMTYHEEQYQRSLFYCLKSLDWLFAFITDLEEEDKDYLMSLIFRYSIDPEWVPRFKTRKEPHVHEARRLMFMKGISPLLLENAQILPFNIFRRPHYKEEMTQLADDELLQMVTRLDTPSSSTSYIPPSKRNK